MAKKKKKKKKAKPQQVQEEEPKLDLYEMGYLDENVSIGDDGYPMTHARLSMQRLCSAWFIWAIIAMALGIFAISFTYTQSEPAQIQIHEYNLALLLRIEGAFCFLTGILSFVLNVCGSHSLYAPSGSVLLSVMMVALVVISLAYEAVALFMINLPDPVSFVNLILIVLMFSRKQRVDLERPILEKAGRE